MRKSSLLQICLLFLIAVPAFGQTVKTTYVKAGNLFESQSGAYRSNTVLVIEGERIKSPEAGGFAIQRHSVRFRHRGRGQREEDAGRRIYLCS
ncbi:hypothetical protein [Alloacidobacterium dinghuense]|uniref:hypothetical protein n=1 Tax=Alloacidobacterium dinghuense TaxID=2763107 RepID=UPI002036A5BB|nr:hypothetical protein [Alloacidobacterium dinghuense]